MMIGEGAEARIYSEWVFGKELLVKERHAKKYRIPQLDLSIRRWRTRNEARIMSALYEAGIRVPRIIALGEFTVYMEKLEGRLMKDSKPVRGTALQCGRMLAQMHNIGIVHGDFTPANIIVCNGSVHAIDFGLSGFSKDSEERALDMLLMKRSLARDMYAAFEMAYSKFSKDQKEVLKRLAEIELRGRYQSRTIA